MILTCPNCSTRYTLQDAQLPAGGRTVRCAACKTTWHAERNEDPIDLPLPAKPAPPRPEDLRTVKAEKLPGQYRAMVEDKKRVKALTAQGIVWAVLGCVAVSVLAVGYFLRVDIVRAFPRIAGAYAMVGMKVYGTHLQFGEQTADSGFKNGRFVVTVKAEVTNTSDKPAPVPPVRVTLLDKTLQAFDTVLMPSNGLVVEPHDTKTLTFDVKDPKNLAASVDLAFDIEAMKAKSSAKAALRHATDDSHGDGDHGPAPASEADHEEAGHKSTGHDAKDGLTPQGHDAGPDAGHDGEDHAQNDHADAKATPGLRPALSASDHNDHAPTQASTDAHGHS